MRRSFAATIHYCVFAKNLCLINKVSKSKILIRKHLITDIFIYSNAEWIRYTLKCKISGYWSDESRYNRCPISGQPHGPISNAKSAEHEVGCMIKRAASQWLMQCRGDQARLRNFDRVLSLTHPSYITSRREKVTKFGKDVYGMQRRGRKGEGRARRLLIWGVRKTTTVTAWRLVEPQIFHKIPAIDHRSSNDQVNNLLFVKIKKLCPTKYGQFQKNAIKTGWFSFDPSQVVRLVTRLSKWDSQVERASRDRPVMGQAMDLHFLFTSDQAENPRYQHIQRNHWRWAASTDWRIMWPFPRYGWILAEAGCKPDTTK